jgi:hypothetical protein
MSVIYYLFTSPSQSKSYYSFTHFFIGIILVFIILFLIQKAIKSVPSRKSRRYRVLYAIHGPEPFKENMDISRFKIFVAPASGPRGMTTMGFDEQFAKKYVSSNHPHTQESRWFVGGSTAALRFVALIASVCSGKNYTRRLQEYFTEMTYRKGDRPSVLTPMMKNLIRICCPRKYIPDIIHHPHLHLCIFVVRLRNPIDTPDWKLKISFIKMFFMNAWSEYWLHQCFDTIIYYTGKQPPSFLLNHNHNHLNPIQFEPLTETNIRTVLRATTCIPFVSERITQIGDRSGLFFDGAIGHYHLNLRCNLEQFPVLYLADQPPHTKIKKTFFDTVLPWRGVSETELKYCLRVHPTEFFKDQVPNRRFPHVSDWFDQTYIQFPEQRKHSWNTVYRLSTYYWKQR